MTKRFILVACGSFNPIHNLHLRMLEMARDGIKASYLEACQRALNTRLLSEHNSLKTINNSALILKSNSSDSTSSTIDLVGDSFNCSTLPKDSQVKISQNSIKQTLTESFKQKLPIDDCNLEIPDENLFCKIFSEDQLLNIESESENDDGKRKRTHSAQMARLLKESNKNKRKNVNLTKVELLSNCQFIGLISPVSDGYKKKGLLPFHVRELLVKLALRDSDWIQLSSVEGCRKEWTPTKQVLLEIKEEYNKQQKLLFNGKTGSGVHTEICLVLGGDTFSSMGIPNLWNNDDLYEIFTKIIVVVIHRPGFENKCNAVFENHEVFKKHPELVKRVIFVENELEEQLSSTYIRKCLIQNKSIKYLVPAAVEHYLQKHKIYSESSQNLNSDAEFWDAIKKGNQNE